MAFRWRQLLITSVLAAGMVYYYTAILLPHSFASLQTSHAAAGYTYGDDFYPIWLTARECVPHRLDPYSIQVTREIQEGLFGRILGPDHPGDPSPDYREFSYPAFVDFPALLLAWLPFPAARAVLAVLLPCFTAFSVLLWTRALNWNATPAALTTLVLLTLSSYPGLAALHAQQAGLMVGFLLAASMAALAANRLAWAGCLLAFSSAKPQMVALLILYLLIWTLANWRERWRLAAGFGFTLAALISAALLIWPRWIGSWLHVLWNYRNYSRPPLLGYLFGPSPGKVLIVLTLAGSGALAWRLRRVTPASSQFGYGIAVMLAVTTITLLPEHAVYDHILLLPAIMIAVRSWRDWRGQPAVTRWTLALAAATLLWPWFAALLLDVAQFASRRLAAGILFLPLRTAAATPFAVLATLFLLGRRTSAQNPKLESQR